ncbi:MAG: hypothetical protein Kow001_15060 [Acidobacteriota bacterium]
MLVTGAGHRGFPGEDQQLRFDSGELTHRHPNRLDHPSGHETFRGFQNAGGKADFVHSRGEYSVDDAGRASGDGEEGAEQVPGAGAPALEMS